MKIIQLLAFFLAFQGASASLSLTIQGQLTDGCANAEDQALLGAAAEEALLKATSGPLRNRNLQITTCTSFSQCLQQYSYWTCLVTCRRRLQEGEEAVYDEKDLGKFSAKVTKALQKAETSEGCDNSDVTGLVEEE